MKKLTLMFGCIPVAAMIGCANSYEYNHRTTYINQPHLSVPPGLSGEKLKQDYYPIPSQIEGEVSRESVSLLPPGSQIAGYGTRKTKQK